MKTGLLLLVFFLSGGALLAGDSAAAGGVSSAIGGFSGAAGSVSGTAKIAGLEILRNEVVATPKPGYIHLIWDAFPDRAAIRRAGKAFTFSAAALDLARNFGAAADPAAKVFRVDISEFPEKDDYGAPRWDKVVILGRFLVSMEGGKWIVKKRAS